jgi:transcriptional regulator with XRE-family HTH domain
MASQPEMLIDLGRYLRAQRELARLSLRSLARVTKVSDSYLSQLERGLYQPSPEVLTAIAAGLGIAPDQLFRRMGWLAEAPEPSKSGVPDAIAADARLNPAQKKALTQTYLAMVGDV